MTDLRPPEEHTYTRFHWLVLSGDHYVVCQWHQDYWLMPDSHHHFSPKELMGYGWAYWKPCEPHATPSPLSPTTTRNLACIKLHLEIAEVSKRTQALMPSIVNFKDALRRLAEVEAALALSARLAEALRTMIYETTHLSPENDDGSHDCRISRPALATSRGVLAGYDTAEKEKST